jgi:hypothetical protein
LATGTLHNSLRSDRDEIDFNIMFNLHKRIDSVAVVQYLDSLCHHNVLLTYLYSTCCMTLRRPRMFPFSLFHSFDFITYIILQKVATVHNGQKKQKKKQNKTKTRKG